MTEVFDKRAKAILQNFSVFNNGLVFKKGDTQRTIAESEDVYVRATFGNFPKDFAVADLGKFLGILSLYNDPKVSVNDKTLTLKSGGQVFHYTLASPDVIKQPDEAGDPTLTNELVEFNLTEDELEQASRNIQVGKLPEVAFFANKKKVSLIGFDSKMPTGDVYSVELVDTDKSFNIIFNAHKILSLLDGDYKVTLSEGIARFVGKDIVYYIASEENSKYA